MVTGATTKIEWTEATWNPVTGCTKISEGCRNCYAERLAYRLQAMGNRRYKNGFTVTLHSDLIDMPLRWAKPKMVFVNSMSDLFHEDVPIEFIKSVLLTVKAASGHVFQILTKRPERAAKLTDKLPMPSNVWLGATVESDNVLGRVEDLQKSKAVTKFLSLEPLLGPIERLPLNGIDWVIVGGESGPGARPMKAEWVRNVRSQCIANGVPFFFKQWGGQNKKATGRLLDGRTWSQMPETRQNLQIKLAF